MTTFNPLSYVKRLKEVGVPDIQAEVHAETLSEIIKNFASNFASKEDLKNLETRLDNKINTVESVLSTKISAVDTKLYWLITLVGGLGTLLAVINLVHIFWQL